MGIPHLYRPFYQSGNREAIRRRRSILPRPIPRSPAHLRTPSSSERIAGTLSRNLRHLRSKDLRVRRRRKRSARRETEKREEGRRKRTCNALLVAVSREQHHWRDEIARGQIRLLAEGCSGIRGAKQKSPNSPFEVDPFGRPLSRFFRFCSSIAKIVWNEV